MGNDTWIWKPFGYGLFVAVESESEVIGFAFTCAYVASEKSFQVMMQIGTLALAIGWDFDD